MQRAIANAHREKGLNFLFGYPNKGAAPIFPRLRFKTVGESTLWVKPLRTARKIATFIHPVTAHMIAPFANSLLAANGVDALAHTPLEPLSPGTVAALKGRAVISTLYAFGAGQAATANLTALREAGATVLYGTDFGNSVTPGIDPSELAAMAAAGMDATAILDALTTAPADFWGLEEGRLQVGAPASLLILSGDPSGDPLLLASPLAVYIDGTPVSGSGLGGGGIAVEPG